MARAPRTPRTPKAAGIEAAPAEPDLLENAPLPREATAFIGHTDAVATLASTLAKTPPQGLIFEGPRGIGKATLAFRIAKTLVSESPIDPRFETDSEDRNVRQVSAGTHPSVLHLTRAYDEKTKRFKADLAVDTVRRLVPFLGSTAAGGGHRVVIVDAVDDMNANAANALLKNLEEPPAHTLFVLVAHVAGRVLPTIRSRCQTVRFQPLGDQEVASVLRALGADESLAEAGEGSVRRALTLAGAGADTVRTAQRLLAGDMADIRRWYTLADLAAQKKGEHFAAVADLAIDAFAARAKAHAAAHKSAHESGDGASGTLSALNGYASAYLRALSERRRVEIFNLDRRAFVLSLCEELSAADRAMATRR